MPGTTRPTEAPVPQSSGMMSNTPRSVRSSPMKMGWRPAHRGRLGHSRLFHLHDELSRQQFDRPVDAGGDFRCRLADKLLLLRSKAIVECERVSFVLEDDSRPCLGDRRELALYVGVKRAEPRRRGRVSGRETKFGAGSAERT